MIYILTVTATEGHECLADATPYTLVTVEQQPFAHLFLCLHIHTWTQAKTPFKMSGQSSVGTSGVYEAGDQRNPKNSEVEEKQRYHEGNPNSHKANDSSMF